MLKYISIFLFVFANNVYSADFKCFGPSTIKIEILNFKSLKHIPHQVNVYAPWISSKIIESGNASIAIHNPSLEYPFSYSSGDTYRIYIKENPAFDIHLLGKIIFKNGDKELFGCRPF